MASEETASINVPLKPKCEDDYVFVVSTNDGTPKLTKTSSNRFPTCFSFASIEEAPTSIPFLPLDASTEITKFGGYSEAVESAQKFLDSRLEIYSEFRKMVKQDAASEAELLTPRHQVSRKVIEPKAAPAIAGLGWRQISSIDEKSRNLLRNLQEEGVLYTPHDIAYSVSYLSPVAPYGDCLFLSIEQLLLSTEHCDPLTPSAIRAQAVEEFFKHYTQSTKEEKKKIDSTIRNLYFPDLKGGWGVSHIQTRRFVATLEDKDMLLARIFSLQDRGMSWDTAAQSVYSKYAQPVVNAETYCRYIRVGNPQHGSDENNSDFLIGLNYSASGLVSVDNDPEGNRVAWGDDIVLESLASVYKRDIFVVLVGGGKMFFLPHRPRHSSKTTGLAPWFLLMRATGTDRGGDHYEPMICHRLRGDPSPSIDSIGE